MKRFAILGSLALALAVGLLLMTPSTQAEDAKPTLLGLNGLDPVHLIAGEETRGNPKITGSHGLYEYRFASEENKKKFEADPEKYGIQGDGMCPVVPSAPSDPGIYKVYKEKIYIFATTGCIDVFDEDPDQYVG